MSPAARSDPDPELSPLSGGGPLSHLEILARAIEAMEIGVTITDAQGRITYINAADAQMHGYSVDELIGERSALFAPSPETEVPSSKGPEVGGWLRERVNRRRDGTHFPVRLFSESVVDRSGARIATVTLCEDISDEVEATLAIARRDRVLHSIAGMTVRLLAAEDWSAAMTDSLRGLQASTEMDGAAFVPNPSAAQWPGSDLEPVAVGSVVPSWSPEIWAELFRALGDSDPGPIVVPDQRGLLPAGLRNELDRLGVGGALLAPAVVSQGVLGFVVLLTKSTEHDWTPGELEAVRIAGRFIGAWQERRRAELALAQAEKGFRDLVEGGSDLILSMAADGRLLYVNPEWCTALGHPATAATSLTIFDIVEPPRREACREALGRLLESGVPERLQTVFRSRDGRALLVEGSISVRAAPNNPSTFIGIFRDVTQRAELERMREEFISTVSHELRTPLTSILGSLSLLRQPLPDGQASSSRDLIAIAHRNSERLLKLISDLLDLQKLTAGSVRFEAEPIAVGELLDDVSASVHGLAEPLGVRLVSSTGDPGAVFLTDRHRVSQILLNLLSNAIRFSPRSGVVRLTAEATADQVVFRIVDDGPGIPLDFQRRMFERFSQAPGSRKAPRSGSGLGLAIVKSLVDRFDGSIMVDSAPGRGTEVRVALPRVIPLVDDSETEP